MKQLQAIDYAVQRTGLSAQSIYEACRQNTIPHVRCGRRVLFDQDVLEAWIQEGGQALPGGWRREPEGR